MPLPVTAYHSMNHSLPLRACLPKMRGHRLHAHADKQDAGSGMHRQARGCARRSSEMLAEAGFPMSWRNRPRVAQSSLSYSSTTSSDCGCSLTCASSALRMCSCCASRAAAT